MSSPGLTDQRFGPPIASTGVSEPEAVLFSEPIGDLYSLGVGSDRQFRQVLSCWYASTVMRVSEKGFTGG